MAKFCGEPCLLRANLAEVGAASGDSERAHGLEDKLWEDVLYAIAEGECAAPDLCAKMALRTKDFKFGRWYA